MSERFNPWAPERISVMEVPAEDLREVLQELLNHLGLAVYREQTPDYTSYEIRASRLLTD